jgi:hypothetical protein
MEQAGSRSVDELFWEEHDHLSPFSDKLVLDEVASLPPSGIVRDRQICLTRRAIWTAACCLIVVIASISFGVGFGLAERENTLDESAGTMNTGLRPQELYSAIMMWGVTAKNALDDAMSPQGRALAWLQTQVVDSQDLNHALTRFALASLYYSTNAMEQESGTMPWWKQNSHWLSDDPVCSWYGVECVEEEEETQGRVVALNLSSNGLAGTLPAEIALLQADLRVLDLSKNDIEGNIPAAIEGLHNLGKSGEVWCNQYGMQLKRLASL